MASRPTETWKCSHEGSRRGLPRVPRLPNETLECEDPQLGSGRLEFDFDSGRGQDADSRG